MICPGSFSDGCLDLFLSFRTRIVPRKQELMFMKQLDKHKNRKIKSLSTRILVRNSKSFVVYVCVLFFSHKHWKSFCDETELLLR